MADTNPTTNPTPNAAPNPQPATPPTPNNNGSTTPPPNNNEKKSGMNSKSIIAIVLLLFLYPIGLIVMWFMTSWPKWVKILLTLPIFLGIAVGVLAAFGIYQVSRGNPAAEITPTPELVACTQEVKLCDDGVTYVGREGPQCEFKACPDTQDPAPTTEAVEEFEDDPATPSPELE